MIDTDTAPQLRDELTEAIEPNRAVILDMAQVTHIDGTAMRTLEKVYSSTGERVVIRNPSHCVRGVMATMDTGKPAAWVMEVVSSRYPPDTDVSDSASSPAP